MDPKPSGWCPNKRKEGEIDLIQTLDESWRQRLERRSHKSKGIIHGVPQKLRETGRILP